MEFTDLILRPNIQEYLEIIYERYLKEFRYYDMCTRLFVSNVSTVADKILEQNDDSVVIQFKTTATNERGYKDVYVDIIQCWLPMDMDIVKILEEHKMIESDIGE